MLVGYYWSVLLVLAYCSRSRHPYSISSTSDDLPSILESDEDSDSLEVITVKDLTIFQELADELDEIEGLIEFDRAEYEREKKLFQVACEKEEELAVDLFTDFDGSEYEEDLIEQEDYFHDLVIEHKRAAKEALRKIKIHLKRRHRVVEELKELVEDRLDAFREHFQSLENDLIGRITEAFEDKRYVQYANLKQLYIKVIRNVLIIREINL